MSDRLSKISTCIRRVANTARLPRTGIVDRAGFSIDSLSPELSGKYSGLARRIKNLDAVDMRKYGQKFKHFIFTDLRDGAFGGKAIAAFLIRGGFEFALGPRGLKETGSGSGSGDRFAILQSQPLWGKPLTVGLKKAVLETYNKRPDNIHGELLRILVLDSKFKEGIDLFDVKYCHIMEEPIASSDMTQAIGRATRFCGQKGLPFVEGIGWTLNVFVYRTVVPGVLPFVTEPLQSIDAHSIVMARSGLDLSLLVLTKEITELAIRSAVDRSLTREINPQRHHSQVGGSFESEFGRYAWPVQTLRNACDVVTAPGTAVRFTPTQQFVRHYLTPEGPTKGLLAWHSVGTGKTCTAVATASGAFLSAGYRILWVTRNSLMSDVWKNVFNSVCYMPFRRLGVENRGVGSEEGRLERRGVSPLFMKPISYKMFQNALEKKNDLGRALYRANGEDMLRRTFLVIDEVHKLHDGDLLATEKADFNVIQSYIWKSYRLSGSDSVRPLLMSATPIGDTPASLFDILNTLIPDPGQGFMALEHFRRRFVDEGGHVSADGAQYFMSQAQGLISYLNRERDPTTFAIPTIRTITVGLGDIDIPDVRAVARRCLPVIEAAGGKTQKKARRSCYLGARSEFTRKYKLTQRSQMAECFGAKAAKPDFPNYAEFVGEVGGLGEMGSEGSEGSEESSGTGDAVVNK